ncbi:MAG: hypothetical protein U9R74_08410 [Pseudomonadota bacterium]|nr:hypothetical protein [Pseudomonadota bacterium]
MRSVEKTLLNTAVIGLSLFLAGPGASDEAAKAQFSAPGSQQVIDYERAKWDPIHFKPAIDAATNEQCLSCHQEILDRRVLTESPVGVRAGDVLAWYQTLDSYIGVQETFHRRHLVTPLAGQVMDLKCNTCHQGNDPREETANSNATGDSSLTQRKMVDPNTCLMCHGQFPAQVMNLPGPWHEVSKNFGDSCLGCHAAIRTERHNVNFLKPTGIEQAALETNDVCYGCHGGRSWYRISYPYPRHPWPGMAELVPDWAKARPSESAARFRPDTASK